MKTKTQVLLRRQTSLIRRFSLITQVVGWGLILTSCENFNAYRSRCYSWCAHEGGEVVNFQRVPCDKHGTKHCFKCDCELETVILQKKYQP